MKQEKNPKSKSTLLANNERTKVENNKTNKAGQSFLQGTTHPITPTLSSSLTAFSSLIASSKSPKRTSSLALRSNLQNDNADNTCDIAMRNKKNKVDSGRSRPHHHADKKY